MDIAVLLIATLILGKTIKSDRQQSLIMIAGPLLGICYFFIWPLCAYYLSLNDYSEIQQQIALSILVIATLIISRLALLARQDSLLKILSISLFLLSWLITANYQIDIKDKLAEYAGIFISPLPETTLSSDHSLHSIDAPDNTYTMAIPKSWELITENSSGRPFYTTQQMNNGVIEFRPGCYNRQMLAITELVTNLARPSELTSSSEHTCYLWQDIGYACRISLKDSNETTRRIYWIAINKKTNRMLDLDFVTHINLTADLDFIDSLFKSIKLTDATPAEENCTTPVKWM